MPEAERDLDLRAALRRMEVEQRAQPWTSR
jgi:hypothetical protein